MIGAKRRHLSREKTGRAVRSESALTALYMGEIRFTYLLGEMVNLFHDALDVELHLFRSLHRRHVRRLLHGRLSASLLASGLLLTSRCELDQAISFTKSRERERSAPLISCACARHPSPACLQACPRASKPTAAIKRGNRRQRSTLQNDAEESRCETGSYHRNSVESSDRLLRLSPVIHRADTVIVKEGSRSGKQSADDGIRWERTWRSISNNCLSSSSGK